MTISANKIVGFPENLAILSDLQIEETIAKALQTVEEARSGKTLLTASAPSLSLLELNEPKKEISYLQSLLNYMASVLVSGTKQLNTQMKSVDVQEQITQLQMRLIQEAQRISEEQADAAEHSPWKSLLQVLSFVGAAVMIVAGSVTGNPALVVGGASLVVMTATNAGEALSNAMADWPVVAKIFTIIAISVAAAALVSYAGVALGAAAGETAGGVAAETAASAAEAATVTADAGAATATAASTTAETTTATTSSAAAAAEAESGAAAVIGGDTGASASSAGVTMSQIGGRSLLISTMFNLFGEIARALAAAAKASKEDQETAAMIVSIVSTVAAVAISYRVETSAASGASGTKNALSGVKQLIEFIIQKLPSGEKIAERLPTILQGIMIVNSLAQTGLSINEGVFMLKQAETQFKFGKAQSDINFYNDLMNQNHLMIKNDQEAIKASAKSFAKMNDHWDSYVEPYRFGVENMA